MYDKVMADLSLLDKIRNTASDIIRILLSVIMAIFSYAGVMEFIWHDSIFRLISYFTVIPAFFFFVIFIHEMGHAIAAWSLKWRVHFIAVGIIGYNTASRKFEKVKDFSKNEIAGFVRCSPKWPVENRWEEIIVSFCGPLATIILGFVFLYLHENFGYGVEFFTPDKHTTTYAGRPKLHSGFLLLAYVCFLDAVLNLIPLKSGDSFSTDGLSIFKSLFKSEWTLKNWLYVRTYIHFIYNQEIGTDSEWTLAREDILALLKRDNDEDLASLLKSLAWAQTDPETFVAIIDQDSRELKDQDEQTRRQYVASRLLIGPYNQELENLMPALPEDYQDIHLFAKAILKYAKGDHLAAAETIREARQAYADLRGVVPDEEEAIFTAIENKTPFPKLKW